MVTIEQYLKLLPALSQAPERNVWLSYDAEADVLYINFKHPGIADDSELRDDDIIVRYEGESVIGYTVLNASKRHID